MPVSILVMSQCCYMVALTHLFTHLPCSRAHLFSTKCPMVSVGVPAMPKCQHVVTWAGLFAPVPSPNATIVVIDMPGCAHCVLASHLLAQALLFTYLLTLTPHLSHCCYVSSRVCLLEFWPCALLPRGSMDIPVCRPAMSNASTWMHRHTCA